MWWDGPVLSRGGLCFWWLCLPHPQPFILSSRANKILNYVFIVLLVVKNLPANAGDIRGVDSILESGRSPGGGHGPQLQYSCLENCMDREACRATVHKVAKSRTWLMQLSTHVYLQKYGRFIKYTLKSTFPNWTHPCTDTQIKRINQHPQKPLLGSPALEKALKKEGKESNTC